MDEPFKPKGADSKQLKQARQEANMSAQCMADTLGVSRRKVHYIESGRSDLTIKEAQTWLHATRAPVLDFLLSHFPALHLELKKHLKS
ncbi:helix-turn-helix transcriptional regulator [Ferrimonas kyonanensis]|uniref:helix-turn-helix transcriptional regulator n=1 Tax=Ferrimonas kyonanensis TaxID=364763 RepID=UPI000485B4AD|nr:helix-turn-helix transcriptional regulator [Ferrimonas kyonanensis]